MLQRVTIPGIDFPRLYIAENKADVKVAIDNGIPFIRWSRGKDELIKTLLRPVLKKMFPDIKWDIVLGAKRRFRTKLYVESYDKIDVEEELDIDEPHEPKSTDDDVAIKDDSPSFAEEDDGTITEAADAAEGERLFTGGGGCHLELRKLSIDEYVGDLSSCVNLEVLQSLHLMPQFIGDILDCIKVNIGNGIRWREGYNKRLGIPVGRYDAAHQLPNLIILDVSGSIPRGISATMILLIDTLRSELSADLIITSSISRFYPMGSELPDPDDIRCQFGYGNEAAQFNGILEEHIKNRHYGHVFSFGDNDTPLFYSPRRPVLEGTIVEHVHHYHTGLGFSPDGTKTGYAKWCDYLSKQPSQDFDTSWCEVIRN